jgi:hypothetical protein
MSKKKTTKSKKTNTKAKKDVNINDIDAMLEEMKNLVLEDNTQEKINVDVASEEDFSSIEKIETQQVEDTLEETVNEDTEMVNETKPTSEEKKEDVIIEETEIGNIDNEIGPKEPIILNSEEDFDKVYEEEKPKSKKRTYQDMFGGTWMGYGYSEF